MSDKRFGSDRRSWADQKTGASRQRMSGKRIAVVAVVLLALLIAYAWIDGGEEPLRPIAQPISLPENAG